MPTNTTTTRRQARIRERLNDVGLKATPQRLTVLQTMLTHERRHLSAADVHQRIAQQNGRVGMATIYRVLGQLTGVGILARHIFEKLSSSKKDRGPALVGLAEISFQEKNYAQAVRSAQLAADRGGGVRARVLQGDAHFRLSQFKEAAKAYEAALKMDPMNASAKSGLALANKRM